MPFKKGKPRAVGAGRKKGTPNKTTKTVQTWAQSVIEDRQVQARTLVLAQQGRLAPAILIELLHYAYGKPKDTVNLTGAGLANLARAIRVFGPGAPSA